MMNAAPFPELMKERPPSGVEELGYSVMALPYRLGRHVVLLDCFG